MKNEIEPVVIDATDGTDFQEYEYINGSKVSDGEPVGVECVNPRTGQTEFFLFSDVRYSDSNHKNNEVTK